MELKDVQQYLEENNNNEEIKKYLEGLQLPTLEGIKSFVTENEEAKKWLDSEKHSHFDKGLATWMEKTFPTKLEEEYQRRNPNETPEQKEIRELKEANEKLILDKKLSEVSKKTSSLATEKNIPLSLVDFLLDANEEVAVANLNKFEEAMKPYIQTQVEQQLKDNSYTPPNGGNTGTTFNGLSPTQLMSQGFTHTK